VCESVQAIIWNADPETLRFSLVNKEAERILGYWIERWYNEVSFLRRHLHPKDVDCVLAICAKAAEDGKRHEFDHRMVAVDGRVVWFHTSVNLSVGPGARRELSGVMADITARRQAEQANRELSRRVLRVRDEERRRISVELHDSLGQYLTALKINLAILARDGDSRTKRRRILNDTTELADSCIEEVRNYAYLLHPPTLDLLGLSSALE
jgi:PAS domain S-box-containing protein